MNESTRNERIYIHLRNDVDEYDLADEPEQFGEPVWTRRLSPEFIEEYKRISDRYDEMRSEIHRATEEYFAQKQHARETMAMYRAADARGLAVVRRELP
jgi:hypothetical protein